MHESEKWKWNLSVVSDPQRPHGLQPSRPLHPWDFPGKSTRVGRHCLLRLSAIRMMSSAYLRLLIFLLAILIPAYAFLMMYTAYKLNKLDDHIQPFPTFPDLEPICCSMSGSNCCFLTCIHISQKAGQVVWYSHLLKNFPQFVVIHTVEGFSVVNEAEVNVFLEFPWFFYDPMDVDNLISGSFAFSKSSLYIWKLSVHVLLKPSLEDFQHYLASMWNEHNRAVLWAFFGIALLWDRNENWLFPVLWPLLSFPNLLAYGCGTFTASSFTILNNKGGIPSPPLALFVVMLLKDNLTSHPRMSGSR